MKKVLLFILGVSFLALSFLAAYNNKGEIIIGAMALIGLACMILSISVTGLRVERDTEESVDMEALMLWGSTFLAALLFIAWCVAVYFFWKTTLTITLAVIALFLLQRYELAAQEAKRRLLGWLYATGFCEACLVVYFLVAVPGFRQAAVITFVLVLFGSMAYAGKYKREM